jgi:PAS domain S-box-containing protein
VDGIITIDEDGTVESFNPAAERIFGYRADEVIGRNVKLLMPAPYAQEHDGYIANFVHTGIARIIGIGREVTGCRKDGSTFPMDLAVSQFQADGGRRFTGIVRDITARKAAEQALQDADRRKDEFLATLAHELRNPLAPIRNALELLNRAGNDPAVFADTREMMERQLGHIVRLVDDLLDVSRITSGKMQLRKEQVDLAAVVNSAVEACRPNADDMGHQLTVSLPPQPLMLNADRTRLAQLFSNLLNNAVKYTPWGGHIWLTAERQGSQLSVSVRDTGIGISREHLPRVFEMFSQAAPALERSQGGLGIGLALAHGLVELHGGTIEARSDGIGKGSEFLVILPIDAAEQMTRLERKPREVTKRPSRECRILIVDDNRDSADSLQRLLRLEGHETQLAFDGLEAVQTAAAFRPQVVLLDIGLPKMNGYEVAKRIRQHDWGRSMVLIALTGWGQEEDKNRAFEAGFDHHLTKPVDPSALDRLLAMDSVCGPASPVESAH